MYIPKRMCVSCRQRKTKDDLIRIAKCNDTAIIDQNKAERSRAIYVCKDIKCVEQLKKNKAINRFLGVDGSEELYNSLKNKIN